MIQSFEYKIDEEIVSESKSRILRVVRKKDNKNLVLKLPRSEFPTLVEMLGYQFEYDILNLFSSNQIIKVFNLEKNNSSMMLVLEDFGGINLEEFWTTENIRDVRTFLNCAIQMSQALIDVHSKDVIHKDINLSNFLIHPETKAIKLIDFGIATVLNREIGEARNIGSVDGTLEYISPEQTGRMNRSLDYRTDLYSLGICFYKMLTGDLPFQSSDPLEVIYGHLAKKPMSILIKNPSCPIVLAQIVDKLISKSAEDRYQSAIGLRKDLVKCLDSLSANMTIPDFKIADNDVPIIFEVSQKLFGREKEVKILFDEFDKISQGESCLLMIGGYSGIGKTSLVNEVHKPLVQKKANFTSGKYDQFNRNSPYSALLEALSKLIHQFLSDKSENTKYWKEKIQNAVGSNGQILVELIPSLGLLIGPQSLVQPLGPTEAQARLQRVFKTFIQSIASKDHPLVVFLDDLQWSDSSSLLLLEYIFSQKLNYILFITAYRDNEVSPSHPFIVMTESLKKQEVSVHAIILNALGLMDIQHIIGTSLRKSFESVLPLAKLMEVKTGGNPFFLVQQLYSLYDQKLLLLDPKSFQWTWDFEAIQKIGLSDNIIELLTKKISTLPNATKELIRIASFLGNKFDIQTLSSVSQKEFEALIKDLWPALKEGLVESISENYSFSENFTINAIKDFFKNENSIQSVLSENINKVQLNYKFLHDRVQQAAYQLTSNDRLPDEHLRVGRLLLKNYKVHGENSHYSVFDIVNHLNNGKSLITEKAERIELAELNYIAGKKAKLSSALKAANDYFIQSLELYADDIWDKYYEKAMDLYCDLVETEYLVGNLDSSAERAKDALKYAKTPFDKGRVYTILIPLYSSRGNGEDLTAALDALKVFDIQVPIDELGMKKFNSHELKLIHDYLDANPISNLYSHKALQDENIRMLMKILVDFWVAAYFGGHPLYMAFAVYKLVNLSIQFGHADASALGYALYSSICRVGEENYIRSDELGKLSIELIERYPNPVYKARLCNIYGHVINPYFRRVGTSQKYFEESQRIGPEVGEVLWAVWAAFFVSIIKNMNGDKIEDVLNETYKFSQFLENSNDKAVFTAHRIHQQILLGYLGKTKSFDSIDRDDFNEENAVSEVSKMQAHFAVLWHSAFRSQSHIINGNFLKAYQVTQNADYSLGYDIGLITSTNHMFFQSIAISQIFESEMDQNKKDQMKQFFSRNIAKFKLWATYGKINFQHRYLFLLAEENRIFGDKKSTSNLYKNAISEAENQNFPQDAALFCEIASKYFFLNEQDEEGSSLIKKSYNFYSKWGATAKASLLSKTYPQFFDSKKKVRENTTLGMDVNLLSVIKAMQVISSEIDQHKLIPKLVQILMENSGAQKAVLLLEKKNEFRVKYIIGAEGSSDLDQSIDDCNQISRSIIRSVSLSRKMMIVDDALNDTQLLRDDYIQKNKTKSIMCIPMMNQSRPLGLVYFENNSTNHAFNENHKVVLEMLATQAGISIDVANLYRDMELRVEEKTEELRQAQAQIVNSSKMSALGEMSGGIAHEINSPLATIKISSDLLKKMFSNPNVAVDPDKGLKLISSILKTTERISKIVQGLKVFSRDASQDPVQPVRVEDLIESTVNLCSARFRDREIELKIESFEPNLKFEGRDVEISQVLLNLLNNAYDAVENLSEKWVMITINELNNFIEFRVTDSGRGISAKVEERLFQPFFTTKDIGKGTGLGLSISIGIIKKHNGEIKLDKSSQNTCFVFTLPKSKD